MFWKFKMEIYKVLEIIEIKTPYDCRLEYRISNGKYIKNISQEEFLKGETII